MSKTLSEKIFIITFLSLVPVTIIGLHSTCVADQNNDFFAPNRDEILLQNVEKYHLGPNNFWEKYRSGKFNYALQELDFVLRYYPNHPKALLLVGSIAKLTQSPSVAIPYYDKALRLFPQYALTHAQYGAFLVEIGNIAGGIAKLKEAIKMDPNLAPARAWLADAYQRKGELELARQEAVRAKELGYRGTIKNNETERKTPE
jgi:Tfp pilus assembly protein PilF